MAFVMVPAGMQSAFPPVFGGSYMMPAGMPSRGLPVFQQHQAVLSPPPFPPQMYAASAEAVALSQAVESLYRDGMKPYGRLLKKRLVELAHLSGRGCAERDMHSLRAACEASPYLAVLDGEGGDWAALLPGAPEAFVDVYSPHDCYWPELWTSLAAYLSGSEGVELILPGGRYSCAQVLVQRRLPCLAGYSLGQVSHIVQLAISQKKLLGYLNGNVVPYGRSQSMVKDRSAQRQRPCESSSSRRSKSTAFATWDIMRPCLQQLLSVQGGQAMPLSNLKRLFRVRFNVELSETALGHAKLSECLQDPRVCDLCDVKLQGQGYIIIPAQKPVAARGLISLVEGLPVNQEPSGFEGQAAAAQHSHLLCRRGASIQPLSMMEVHDSPEPSPTAAAQGSRQAMPLPQTPCPQTPFPPTPSPSAVYMRSLPRLLGRVHPPQVPALGMSKILGSVVPAMGKQPVQDVATLAKRCSPVARTRHCADALPPMSPSTFGLLVQNTFLNFPLPPPTPLRAAARFRARSLPRASTERP